MTVIEALREAVILAENNLTSAKDALASFEALPENHVYETLERALGVLENVLRERAHADCEGSYNCGQSNYTQEFIVNGVHYRADLNCEYNRHDKTYYYLEESELTYKEILV